MKIILFAFALAAVLSHPAYGDDVKPLDSPIHMTYLPVPDEFRSAPAAIESAHMAQDTSSARPVLDRSVGIRDDSDANFGAGGRR